MSQPGFGGPVGPGAYGPTPGQYGPSSGPYGPPPGGPRRSKTGLVWLLVIVSVLVFAGVAGGLTWFLLSGRDEGTSASAQRLTGTIDWQARSASAAKPLDHWVADDVVVQVTEQKVTAFSKRDGTKAWELTPPPTPGGTPIFCGMSASTDNGFGAISFGTKGAMTRCTQGMVVDLRTGKPTWKKDIAAKTGYSMGSTMVSEVVGDHAIFEYDGDVRAFDIRTGQQRWEHINPGFDCRVTDLLANTETLAMVSSCSDDKASLLLADPATGEVRSETPAGTFDDPPTLVSVDPLVLQGGSETEELLDPAESYITFDESGREQATIAEDAQAGSLKIEQVNDGPHARYPVVVGNGLLVTVTEDQQASQVRFSNKVVAFDLKTGQQRWAKPLAEDLVATVVAKVNGGFLAINDGTFEKPPQLMRLDSADGSVTPASPPFGQPGGDNDLTSMSAASFAWEGDALYGMNNMGAQILPSAFAFR